MLAEQVQALLSPLEYTSACGAEIEYDPEYIELQVAAAEKVEQQFGTTIIPAQQPNWSDVAQRAGDLLRRTKDLRVLAYVARASAEIDGLPGYANVLELALRWLELYWKELYPRIQIDGEEDPLPRINAISSLMEIEGVGRALRRAPLAQGDFGRISLREVELYLDKNSYLSGIPGDAQLRQKLISGDTPEINAVRRINTTALALTHLIESHLGTSWTPDFSGMTKPFEQIVRALDELSGTHAISESPAIASEYPTEQSAPAPQASGTTLERREQAMQQMESICRYFERYEPGHPAALLIRRAQRLMPLNFMEIIQDLAPESGQTFEHIVGCNAASNSE